MNLRRKAAAITLSLIMIITMMPAAVFAENAVTTSETSFAEGISDASEQAADDAVSPEAAEEQAAYDEEAAVGAIDETAADTGESEKNLAAEDSEDEEAADEPAAADEASEEAAEDEEFEGTISFSEGIDPDLIRNTDPEKLMEKYMLSDEDSASAGYAPDAPLSVKGDRLTGNNEKYYKYFKSIIKDVNAGKRNSTTITVPVTKITGKKTITAKSLGLSKLAYVKGGRLHLTSKAEKKINAMINPENWGRVYSSLMSDYSSDSYWVNWYDTNYFYKWSFSFRGNTKSITIIPKGAPLTLRLPVMPEFASSAYKASQSKLKSAKKAKDKAKEIVRAFDDFAAVNLTEESPALVDYLRLWYYCRTVASLTEYDVDSYEAARYSIDYWGSRAPWSLISVFDDDSSTKAVCAGYARAFKYLCDLSTFNSSWIDCQIATGDVTSGGTTEGHMWNTVRMNDGLNYMVDPTWADDEINGEVNEKWFLRGDPAGSANAFTVEDSYRVYDDWMRAAFAPAERRLAKKSRYDGAEDREITLTGTRITKKYRKSRAFSIKWKPVKTALGALYIDGYQIQYSRKKNMKGARSVYVRGYASSSKTIKKLKKKTTYYVRIRTYAKVGKETYNSEWSAKKKIRTK